MVCGANEIELLSESISNYDDEEETFNQFPGFPNDFDIEETVREKPELKAKQNLHS